jgi:hypothetical protein
MLFLSLVVHGSGHFGSAGFCLRLVGPLVARDLPVVAGGSRPTADVVITLLVALAGLDGLRNP